MDNFVVAFFTYLSLILIASKLWGYIHWPWWVVFAPFVVLVIVGCAGSLYERYRKRDDRPEALKRIQNLLDEADRK